ncbi:MAG: hypothetical protein NTY74_02395 [Ignavibacteriae bacterium]|nr:hypothetical protein [Ignavibacteriota bacterium]
MIPRITDEFRKSFDALPKEVQSKALSKFKIWKNNPGHPSLRFKQIHNSKPVYSIRISIGFRALGLKEDATIIWFWIGSHSDYDKLLKNL